MRELRFALHPPPSGWTAGQLARLYEHLPAGSGERLRLDWVHRPELPESFYRMALALQAQSPGARARELCNTIEADPAAIEGPLRSLLSEPSSGIAALELLVRDTADVAPPFERLRAEVRVALSAALVLTRSDLGRLDRLFRLCEGSGIRAWRLAFDARLTTVERREALEQLSDLLVGSSAAIRLEPIAQYLAFVRGHHDPSASCGFFDRRAREDSYSVEAEGRVNGQGNLLATPLGAIVQSPEYQRAIIAGERAMLATCGACRFYGSCPGEAVARTANAREGTECGLVRPLLQQIEQRLRAELPAELIALQPGARVRFATPGATLEERCRLSAGTCAPVSGEPRYHVGALIPRPPWRAPTGQELALLRAEPGDAGAQLATDVAIIRLPDEALAALRAICRSQEQAGSGCPAPLEDPRAAAALHALERDLQPYVLDDRAIESAVLYRSEPGLPTVTRVDRGQPDREVHVGLHLDSWEGTSLRRRAQIRNRIGVNLSRGSRYLLFINLTLAQMMRTLGLDDRDDLEQISLFSGHRFMRRFPGYPVVRIELQPGEAYIAPTGNLVHDGASAEGETPDFALHLLGYFGLPS